MPRLLAMALAASAALCLPSAASAGPKLQLIQLKCVKAQELTHPDSPYLVVEGRRVAGPFKMSKGSVRDLTTVPPIPFDGSVTVELYEEDKFDPDDLLGEQVLRGDAVGAKRKVLFTEDGAHYELTYKVVR